MEKIIVFGAGGRTNALLNDSKWSNKEVLAICDNDKSKHGMCLMGIPIISPENISKYDPYRIFVTPRGVKWSIVQQLLKLGVTADKIAFYEHADDLDLYDAVDSSGKISAKINGINLLVQHASDEMIINEVLLEEGYQFHLGADVQKVVMDVGMNVGIASLYFAMQDDVERVYGYEPFADPFKCAQEKFKLNKIASKIIPIKCGISDESKQDIVPFNKDWITASRTFYSELPQNVLEKIELRDAGEEFKRIRDKEGGNKKYIVKIDCEGSEYQVLNSLEQSGQIKHIDMILGETHDARERDAFAVLKRNNFSFFYRRISPTQCIFKAVRGR